MPSWQRTPRGERIVFGKHGDKPEMASIKPDGSGEEILGDGHDPTLSPDGKLICYTGEKAGGVTVFVMNHDGTNKRQVVKEISKVGATFPNWSMLLSTRAPSEAVRHTFITCSRVITDSVTPITFKCSFRARF